MKPVRLASSILALSLAIATPSLVSTRTVLAHVGHGDEFQAEGGINRVEVNPDTDPIMGIQVTPIEAAADGSGAVLIPVTAVVDADGKQLVFVQYENFYEPVPVTTGATQGELIEVLAGVTFGEQLVTQGSLSLYAESRKTQTATVSITSEPAATATTSTTEPAAPAQTDITHAQADAQGVPHSHDQSGHLVASANTAPQETLGLTGSKVAIGAGVLVLLTGAMAVFSGVFGGDRKQKRTVFGKKGGL